MTRLIRGTTRAIERCIARGITTAIDCSDTIAETCGLPLSRFSTPFTKSKVVSQHSFSMHWSNDGMYLYIGLALSNQVRYYVSAGNPWEVDEQSFVDLMRPPSNDTDGVWIKPDGTELWIAHHTGLIAGQTSSYTLPFPYTWTETGPAQPVLIQTVNNSRAEFKHLNDINIDPTGVKLIASGNDSNGYPYQQDMSAWDISTLAYGTDNKIVTASNCFVPPEGDCMYRTAGQSIFKYAFGDSWDLTTLSATLEDSIDLTADMTANIQCMYMTADRMFVIDDNDILYQYDAAT